jgi:hypothetical protein
MRSDVADQRGELAFEDGIDIGIDQTGSECLAPGIEEWGDGLRGGFHISGGRKLVHVDRCFRHTPPS